MRPREFVAVAALVACAFMYGYSISNATPAMQHSLPKETLVTYAEEDQEQHQQTDDSYLPLQDWEYPGMCDQRPQHIPDYCCFGGVSVFREKCDSRPASLAQDLEAHVLQYRQRHDFFNATTFTSLTCNECQIADYMLQHNLTVTFMGDSVIDQTWVGFECSLRRRGYTLGIKHSKMWTRDKDVWWKYGLHDVRVVFLKGSPSGLTGMARLVYAKAYRRPSYGDEFFHVINNSDVVVFDHALHWQPKLYEDFRQEMVEYLKHFVTPQAAHIRLLAWRETPPQHFSKPGGYYYLPGDNKLGPGCVPIRGDLFVHNDTLEYGFDLPTSIERAYYIPLLQNASDMAGVTFRDSVDPDFVHQPRVPFEMVRLPFREFAIPLHEMHPSGEDCTHVCNHALVWDTVWRGLRLAMDRAFLGPVATLGQGFMHDGRRG